MLLRLYNDNSELIDHSKKSFNKPNDEPSKEVVEEAVNDDEDAMEVEAKGTITGANPEEDAIVAETNADAAKQDEIDNTRENAEGDAVAPEDDTFNKTV